MSAGVPHDTLTERIIANHPLQYGIRHVATEDHPFGETVFDPGDDPTVGERYNRCPTCEQWSPCDVRQAVAELARVSRELALANEEIRLREASQIPVIPRGAQARMAVLEREHETMRDALSDLLIHVPNGTAADPYKMKAHRVLDGSRAATPGGEVMSAPVNAKQTIARLEKALEYLAAKNPTSTWDLASRRAFVERAQAALDGSRAATPEDGQ